MISGKLEGIEAIAAREDVSERSARMGLSLAFLAKDIVEGGRWNSAARLRCFTSGGYAAELGRTTAGARNRAKQLSAPPAHQHPASSRPSCGRLRCDGPGLGLQELDFVTAPMET
jgi:hypothetical protein